MIGLTPRFARSCQIAQAEAQGLDLDNVPGADEEDDEDTMKGMARLFAEIGEAFTSMIALGMFPLSSPSFPNRVLQGLVAQGSIQCYSAVLNLC